MFIPFKAEHLTELALQPSQTYLSEYAQAEGPNLEKHPSYTAIIDGKVMGAAGVIEQWSGRGTAWALIGDTGPKDFISIHRAVLRFLDVCYLKRVELTADCDFPAAHRWARMLGFNLECERMVAYAPSGKDCSLYARIR